MAHYLDIIGHKLSINGKDDLPDSVLTANDPEPKFFSGVRTSIPILSLRKRVKGVLDERVDSLTSN